MIVNEEDVPRDPLLRRLWWAVKDRPLTAAMGVLFIVSCVFSATASLSAQRANDKVKAVVNEQAQATERNLFDLCQSRRESRANTRILVQQGDLEATEVLIGVATSAENVDEETMQAIGQLRDGMRRSTDALVRNHAAQDPNCEAEARERRENLSEPPEEGG